MSIIKILDTWSYLKLFGKPRYTVTVVVEGDDTTLEPLKVLINGNEKETISKTGTYYVPVYEGDIVSITGNWENTTHYFEIDNNNITIQGNTAIKIVEKQYVDAKVTVEGQLGGTLRIYSGGSTLGYISTTGTTTYTKKVKPGATVSASKYGTWPDGYTVSCSNSSTADGTIIVKVTVTYTAPVVTTYTLTVDVTGDRLSGSSYSVSVDGVSKGQNLTTDNTFTVNKGANVKITTTNATNNTSTVSPSSSFTMDGDKTVTIKWTNNTPVTPTNYTLTVNVSGDMLSGSSNKVYISGTLKKSITSPTTYTASVAAGTLVRIDTTEATYNSCTVSSSSFSMPSSNKTVTVKWTDNTPDIIGPNPLPTTDTTYTVNLYVPDLSNTKVPDCSVTIKTTKRTFTIETSQTWGEFTLNAGEGVISVSGEDFDDPNNTVYRYQHYETIFGTHLLLKYKQVSILDD